MEKVEVLRGNQRTRAAVAVTTGVCDGGSALQSVGPMACPSFWGVSSDPCVLSGTARVLPASAVTASTRLYRQQLQDMGRWPAQWLEFRQAPYAISSPRTWESRFSQAECQSATPW